MSKKPKNSTSTPSKTAEEKLPVVPPSPDSPSPDGGHNTAFVTRKRLDEAEEELRRQAQKQNDL